MIVMMKCVELTFETFLVYNFSWCFPIHLEENRSCMLSNLDKIIQRAILKFPQK